MVEGDFFGGGVSSWSTTRRSVLTEISFFRARFQLFFCITMVFQYPEAINHTITNIQDECRIHLSRTFSFQYTIINYVDFIRVSS